MKKTLIKNKLLLAVIISFIYFLGNFLIINEYGVSWDFSYHYNAGLWHLNQPLTDSSFIMGPSPPLSDTLPVISKLIFSDYLGILAWDNAYNLYSVIVGSLGVGIVFYFSALFIGIIPAIYSSFTLGFLPRYIGHLHTNMKDVPQAVFFTLTAGLIYYFLKKSSIKNMILASIAFALSYNSKVNAIFLLIIFYSFLVAVFFFKRIFEKLSFPRIRISALFFPLIASLFAFSLWSVFWPSPIFRLKEAFHSYTSSTTNMPILYFGNMVRSGLNVPWHYPFGMLIATTPILVLIFFITGLMFTIFDFLKNKKIFSLYLILWLFIPLARYFKPQMIVIDDIRHFMEVIFPFCIISGIGAYHSFHLLSEYLAKITRKFSRRFVLIFFSTVYLGYLLLQNILYHPYQIAYFSESVGGINGAQDKFDVDFWGVSYKNGMAYLNKNAQNNADITVSMIPDIASRYLRQDLKSNLNLSNMTYAKKEEYSNSDYTVILNRKSFFNWYNINDYLEQNTPVYTVQVRSIPLLYIFHN